MDKEFKINNFDLLRIFAATQVLLVHSYKHLGIVFPTWLKILSTFEGIPMFFVMSGFLISASLERNSNLKNYFRNRALRIYPGLCLCIILSVITISYVGGINFFNKQAFIWFITQCVGIIYTPGFLTHYGIGSYHVSLWTIPIELQFYVVLPIVYFIISKLTKIEKNKTLLIFFVFLICVVAAFIVIEYFTPLDFSKETKLGKVLRYTFLPHIYMFFFGVLMQRIKVYKSKFVANKAIWWIIAFCIYRYLMYVMPGINPTIFSIMTRLFLGVVTLSVAYTLPGFANKLLKGNDISYGVYIYHGISLGVLVQLKMTGSPLYVLIVFVTSCILAFLSWRLVEKPSINKKKNTIHDLKSIEKTN
jgi:peptidoglycan/LPS O-acetylase OafA/YrhL